MMIKNKPYSKTRPGTLQRLQTTSKSATLQVATKQTQPMVKVLQKQQTFQWMTYKRKPKTEVGNRIEDASFTDPSDCQNLRKAFHSDKSSINKQTACTMILCMPFYVTFLLFTLNHR